MLVLKFGERKVDVMMFFIEFLLIVFCDFVIFFIILFFKVFWVVGGSRNIRVIIDKGCRVGKLLIKLFINLFVVGNM